MSKAIKLLQFTPSSQGNQAKLTIDAAARSEYRISPYLYGKFCEHLGHNIYHGMDAEVLFNPTFAHWTFGAGEGDPDGGVVIESDRNMIPAKAQRYHEWVGLHEAALLMRDWADGLAFGWVRLGPPDASVVSPDVGPFGGRAQRFEHAVQDIALGGVLLTEPCDAAPDGGQLQGPIDEKQVSAPDPAHRPEVTEQHSARQGRAGHRLDGVGQQRHARQFARRPGPLHKQALVLALDTATCGVGTDGRSADQGVEIEAVQTACVISNTQVTLVQQGLPEEGRGDRDRGKADSRKGRVGRNDDHAAEGEDKLKAGLQRLQGHGWNAAQEMDGMTAVGHVRDRPALEVAVMQSRQLAQQGQPEAHLKLAAIAHRLHQDRQFEGEKDEDEG